MILEVNNTFDERRMYFLDHDHNRGSNEAQKSNTSHAKFKGSWRKDFHVSPFNSREGLYTLEASDPLGTGSVSNMINLVSTEGHCKLQAKLVSGEPAIDPDTMTAYGKFGFLASWWWVGFVTFPLILKEAVALFFQRRLRVWLKPEPLKESIGRRATAMEQQLEPLFRRYLQHVVEQLDTPLSVKYIASGISQNTTEWMHSPAVREEDGTVDELEFKVLSPEFYTKVVSYMDNEEAFSSELDKRCTIWVSNRDLLQELATKKPPPEVNLSSFVEWAYLWIIQPLRVRNTSTATFWARALLAVETPASFMDAYVLGHESARTRATYRRCALKLLLADRIALGFTPLLAAYRLLVQGLLAWFISWATVTAWKERGINAQPS